MPVEIDGLELVDGGLVSNLPVDVLDSLDVDIKVALNTMGTLYHTTQDLNLPWKTADQVIGILMIKQNNLQLEQADVVISPQLGTHESAEFTKLDSLIEKGYQAGLLVADSLKALVYDHAFSESLLTGDFQPELSSVVMLSDSLRNRFMKIILEHKQPKACLHHLLKTDLLKKAYAEIDTLRKTITYKIELLPAITHLELNGPQYGLTQKLQTCFLPLLNQPYTNWQAGVCLEKAIKIYRQAGYPLTQYEAIIISEDTLKLRFSENRLSDIRINRSRKSTVPAIIERELNFDTTHVLKPEKVRESIQALYNMNIFDRINMWPNYSIDSLNRLSSSMVVNINERFSEILRFGFRFDNTYNSQFMLDFRNENFLGRAIELGGWTSVGSRIFNTQIEFRVHRLWDTYLTFFSTLFYNNRHVFVYDSQFATIENDPKRQRIGDYGQQFYGLRTAIGGQVLRDGQATLEFQLQKAKVYPDDFKIQRESYTFKTLRSRFLVDSRNEPFEAKSGTVLDIYYDFTPEFLGNPFSFSRLFFSFQENTPITSSFRYRLNLNLGIADNRTPLSHQFSMGGVEPLYSIPFYGFYMDEFRGRQVINVGLDFTLDSPLQFVFPTSFSLHYSVGNMWDELSAVTFETLYHGFGTELSLKTPLGPARLILSKAVLSDETNNSNQILFGPTVFHFVLGYQF
jgi:NTE family protein